MVNTPPPFLPLQHYSDYLTCSVIPSSSIAGLKTYFEQFGPVTHCTIMRDGETQRSRGFAFLTFAQSSSVNAVMTREHYLDGKTVRRIDFLISFRADALIPR